MKIEKKKILISPSDINNFVSCKYIFKNQLKFLNNEIRKKEESITSKLWKKFGLEHEVLLFNELKKKFKNHIEIKENLDEKNRFEQTVSAMQSGYDLIYHAYLIDDNLRGEVDFLIKVKKKSELGEYSYEVWDSKISRSPNPDHLRQITAYSYMLSSVQKVIPDKMYLIDGNKKDHQFKPKEYKDLFLYTKDQFTKFLKNIDDEKIYPEKCKHCSLCDWNDICEKQWEDDNYINQIANTNKVQIEKIKKLGIKTIDQLLKSKKKYSDFKINKQIFEKIIEQAKLQEQKRLTGKTEIKCIDNKDEKGFYLLPEPKKGDLFFDIEGFPTSTRPHEYLHGLYYEENSEFKFKYFWADENNRNSEKKIFIELINFLEGHFKKYPEAHIYHYNSYEKRALRELASDYFSEFQKGDEFNDQLLRDEKYVDLYMIVNQGIRTSEKDLKLKTLEKLCNVEREGEVEVAEESVIFYENWLSSRDKKFKQSIIEYNKQDTISTYALRQKLLEIKPQNIPFFVKKEKEIKKRKNPVSKQVKESIPDRETRLINELDELLKNKSANHKLIQELKYLIGFHWRSNKPDMWRIYERKKISNLDLENDNECIGNCTLVSNKPEHVDNGYIYKFKFNDQDYKLKKGSTAHSIFQEKDIGFINNIEEISQDNNILEIISKKILENIPDIISLGPKFPPPAPQLATALNDFIDNYISNDGKDFKHILDILERKFPDIKNLKPGSNLIDYKKDVTSQTIQITKDLTNSYLTIQGPPGTGKTYTSTKIIIDLIKQGKKVGITAHSHSVVKNLLLRIDKEALDEGVNFKGLRKAKTTDLHEWNFIEDKTDGKAIEFEKYSLYAGTAWFFCDPRMRNKMDYMFIDEAGQLSLATTIAVATATKNIVLVGDQMQLSQPIQGIHNGYSGGSSLDFILDDSDTIPKDKGIFLNISRRLNENNKEFISESFYDSRLKSHEITKSRSIDLKSDKFKNEGIFYYPVEHEGCSQRSDEEAIEVEKIYSEIINKPFKNIDENGKEILGKISTKDIMIVAPFNAQVNNIKEKLKNKFGNDTRVGTIDLFQGQEAKVVIISMTSSDAESLPRHIDFFFSRNRLNVAISRAESVAIILFNEKLLLTSSNKIEDMKLINNFCKLLNFRIK